MEVTQIRELDVLKFIDSFGGPFLMLEKNIAVYWNGIDLDGGRSVSRHEKSDYQRASACSGWVNEIVFGTQARGLVFWGDKLPLAAIPMGERDYLIVRPYCELPNLSRDDFVSLAHELPCKSEFSHTVSTGEMIVFDAACSGTQIISDELNFVINPGTYNVSTCEHTGYGGIIFHNLMFLAG